MRQFFFTILGALVAGASGAAEAGPRIYQGVAATDDGIVVSFAGDLWLAPTDGGTARPLTRDKADDCWPVASPDGSLVAFSRIRGGNADVYVVPTVGGEARQLTYHPKDDAPRSWSADGRSIVFATQRDGDMKPGLYTVSVEGGMPERLPIPMGYDGVLSPDGSRLAYNPVAWASEFNTYRYYRGGMTSPLWLTTLDGGETEVLCANDVNHDDPIWIDGKVYYRSDEDGVFNVRSIDLNSREVTTLTDFDDMGVSDLAFGGGALVFERAGRIYRLDPATGNVVQISIEMDLNDEERKPRDVDALEWLQSAVIAPDALRVAIEARGDIFIYNTETEASTNLTNSAGVADRSPVWSPHGSNIAWFSDRGGEYALCIQAADGGGQVRSIRIEEKPSFYRQPVWSPDGRYIAFTGKRLGLWIADLKGGAARRIEQSDYLAQETYDPSWSPEGRYLAYAKGFPNHQRKVFIYDTKSGESHGIDTIASAEFPVFDRSGKYLLFLLSNTSHLSAPLNVWGVLSGALYAPHVGRQLVAVTLHADTPAPGTGAQDSQGTLERPIEFSGLSGRVVPLTLPRRDYTGLTAGPEGVFVATYRKWPESPAGGDTLPGIARIAIHERAGMSEIPGGAEEISVSADGNVALIRQGKRIIRVALSEKDEKPDRIEIESLPMRVEPAAEWRQMYEEAWRLMRDYFYDSNHHGQNLNTLQEHFAAYLPSIVRREDLNQLFRTMLGQISISHMAIGGGDVGSQPGVLWGAGVLGAEFEIVDGHYRIAKVYRRGSSASLNSLITGAPLDQPGMDVREGDYLVAIKGKPVDASENLYAALRSTSGRETEITVAASPDGENTREYVVKPLPGDNSLIRDDWFESNRRRVAELSDGRVGYISMPSFGYSSIEAFYAQAAAAQHAEALVIDQRFNGGGTTSDALILGLLAPRLYHYDFPYGEDLVVPATLQEKPKVLVVNEMNFSAAETFPLMFQSASAGTIVGKRTGGGGTGGALHYPRLIDGGYVVIPNRASFDPHRGEWAENHGVAPDVEVDWFPSDWQQGRDPQLEKAVAIALEKLEDGEQKPVNRPAYPVHPGGLQ